MLVLTDTKGRRHIIAHFQTRDVPAMHEMKRRFNGELALWSSSMKQWIPLAEFDLETANDWKPIGEGETARSPPDSSQGEEEARRLYG